jgi:hypothetical protein
VTAAAFAIAGAAVGCDDSADAPTRCAGTCIADPAPHCLRSGDASAAGCPGGLVHARVAASAACPGLDDAKIDDCRWRPPPIEPIDTLALIDGFAVPPMEMHVAPPPAPAFAWTPPPRATFVACALFTCQPQVDRRKPDDEASSLTGPSRIANAGACVLALEATTVSPAWLPIGERQLPTDDACTPERSFDRVIAFVAAGCWAYDATAVVAASRLVPLRPADLANAAPEVPVGADCRRDGDACYDDGHANPFFGACLGGTCQPRCATAEDCKVAGERLLGQPTGDSCRWACRDVPTSRAGVCAPLAP